MPEGQYICSYGILDSSSKLVWDVSFCEAKLHQFLGYEILLD